MATPKLSNWIVYYLRGDGRPRYTYAAATSERAARRAVLDRPPIGGVQSVVRAERVGGAAPKRAAARKVSTSRRASPAAAAAEEPRRQLTAEEEFDLRFSRDPGNGNGNGGGGRGDFHDLARRTQWERMRAASPAFDTAVNLAGRAKTLEREGELEEAAQAYALAATYFARVGTEDAMGLAQRYMRDAQRIVQFLERAN